MTKEKDQAPISSEEPKEGSGSVAVAEKPKGFEDHEKVTVLYGWNKVPAGSKQFVDKVLFKDGIARDVPYGTVKHWERGTRPDGKNDLIVGKIGIQAVLPSKVEDKDKDGKVVMRDVNESDFAKATGVQPMPIEKFASQLAGIDLEALVTQMGVEKVKALIGDMEKYLPEQGRA